VTFVEDIEVERYELSRVGADDQLHVDCLDDTVGPGTDFELVPRHRLGLAQTSRRPLTTSNKQPDGSM